MEQTGAREGGRREETRSYIIHLGHSVVKDARKASGTTDSRSMRDGDLLRRGCRSRRRGIYLSIRRVYHHHRNIYERDFFFFASGERGEEHTRALKLIYHRPRRGAR